jgi:hypothetical protein
VCPGDALTVTADEQRGSVSAKRPSAISGPLFGAAWQAGRPGFQVGLEFVNQGVFHRYTAVLVAVPVRMNDTVLIRG